MANPLPPIPTIPLPFPQPGQPYPGYTPKPPGQPGSGQPPPIGPPIEPGRYHGKRTPARTSTPSRAARSGPTPTQTGTQSSSRSNSSAYSGSNAVTNLTPHFTLEEFTDSQTAARKGINNVPPVNSQEYRNLIRTAEVMEQVRGILDNKPVLISSGYRSPQVNAAVGGSKTSAHMSGLAADFSCPGFGTPKHICKKLEPHMKDLGIDQLIYEYDTWVHLGLRDPPRHQALTIDNKGTRSGFA